MSVEALGYVQGTRTRRSLPGPLHVRTPRAEQARDFAEDRQRADFDQGTTLRAYASLHPQGASTQPLSEWQKQGHVLWAWLFTSPATGPPALLCGVRFLFLASFLLSSSQQQNHPIDIT